MTLLRTAGQRQSRTPLTPFRDPTAAAALRERQHNPGAEIADLACCPRPAPFNPFRVSDRTKARACLLLDDASLPRGFALAVWLIAYGLYDYEGGDASH